MKVWKPILPVIKKMRTPQDFLTGRIGRSRANLLCLLRFVFLKKLLQDKQDEARVAYQIASP
jgi:hypothetical protein